MTNTTSGSRSYPGRAWSTASFGWTASIRCGSWPSTCRTRERSGAEHRAMAPLRLQGGLPDDLHQPYLHRGRQPRTDDGRDDRDPGVAPVGVALARNGKQRMGDAGPEVARRVDGVAGGTAQ